MKVVGRVGEMENGWAPHGGAEEEEEEDEEEKEKRRRRRGIGEEEERRSWRHLHQAANPGGEHGVVELPLPPSVPLTHLVRGRRR